MNTPNFDYLIEHVKKKPPTVYAKCSVMRVDKKGVKKEQRAMINLSTGDVFKNRGLTHDENPNFHVVRSYGSTNRRTNEIIFYAYQNANIVDENIVLTTWVFGDYVNYPDTTKLPVTWYGAGIIKEEDEIETATEDAWCKINLAEPQIAAALVITREKQIYSWSDTGRYGFKSKNYRGDANTYLAPSLLSAVYNATASKRIPGLIQSFKDMFHIGYLGANKYATFDSFKDVSAFLKAPSLKKNNTANQHLVDELVSIPLCDHEDNDCTEQTICYADRVNEEWAVLRWYYHIGESQYVETSRMYVNKTKAIHCKSDLLGSWFVSTVKLKATTFNADKIVIESNNTFAGTKLEYFVDVAPKLSNQSAALYMLTMYPEFEKLCKSGFLWLCNDYLSSVYQQSWKNYLEERVSHVDWNAKSINKMIGVNHYQIKRIAQYVELMCQDNHTWQTYYIKTIIHTLKNIFDTPSLNSIDDATFDYVLCSMTIGERYMGVYVSALTLTFHLYRKDAIYFLKDFNSILKENGEFVSIENEWGFYTRMSVETLYQDTLRMISLGSYQNEIRPRFSSVEELIGHHQIMIDLTNADKAKNEAKIHAQYNNGFQTNMERWKKWEWSDDTYCVIAPSAPIDVAVEGIALRHCVKSYIPSIAAGYTNVMFIRRKGNEKEPFFTVEVDKSNKIRQVHGMCNCNVSSIDGLSDFIKKWSKSKKLKYNENGANQVRAVG